jgi:hypothetical protein
MDIGDEELRKASAGGFVQMVSDEKSPSSKTNQSAEKATGIGKIKEKQPLPTVSTNFFKNR